MFMFKHSFRTFLNCPAGNTAVMAALAIIPLTMAAGAAIDFGNMARERSAAQSKLDNALLSTIANGDTAGQDTLQKYLDSNIGNMTVDSFQSTSDKATYTMTASAHIQPKLNFLETFGVAGKQMDIKSTVTAPKKLKEVTIEVESARGWYVKILTVKVVRPGKTKAEAETVMTVSYDNIDPLGNAGGGSGDITYTPASTVTLGDFSDFWLEMEVREDLADTSTWHTYATNDPAEARRLYVDGTPLPDNTVVDYTKLVPCGKQVRHAWEDGHTANQFLDQDIVFKVNGVCESSPNGVFVRIVK